MKRDRKEFLGMCYRLGVGALLMFLLLDKVLKPEIENFEEIQVKRINVIGEDGRKRIVISNQAKFPLPVLDGVEYPRSIQPAGIVFYRENGNEAGGIALNRTDALDANHLILDYHRSEAIGFGVVEGKNGDTYAGMSILDKTPLGPIMEVGTTGKERIHVEVHNKDARISLHDPSGNPRILLTIDSLGLPSLKILSPEGELIRDLLSNL